MPHQERSPVPPSKYRLGGGTGWCENQLLRPDFLSEIGDMVGEKHGKLCQKGVSHNGDTQWMSYFMENRFNLI